MMLYRNTKVKVRSPDGDTDYFDIVAGVLQGDTLAPCLFIIRLDDVVRTSIDKMKENGFKLMDEQKQNDQLEPTYNSFVPIQDVVLKTYRKRWTIERSDEKGSGISVLMTRPDNDDEMHQIL